jgi:methionine-rich copper-binding protein CopC
MGNILRRGGRLGRVDDTNLFAVFNLRAFVYRQKQIPSGWSQKLNRIRLSLLSLILFFPSAGFTHAYLVKSLPTGRATLFQSPSRIQLWFNERLEPRFSKVSVMDERGTQVDLGNAKVGAEDPKQLSIGLKPLPSGKYVVRFRVLSVDGHTVEQNFPFTIRESR